MNSNDEEFSKQVGHNDKFNTSKQVIFYEGDIFPFTDNEFDFQCDVWRRIL